MTPLVMGFPAGMEWVILAILALLIFGGSRLAGAGKNAGRAIREFKEETRALKDGTPIPEDEKVVDAEFIEDTPPSKTDPDAK